eukprot:gene12005-biopygen886
MGTAGDVMRSPEDIMDAAESMVGALEDVMGGPEDVMGAPDNVTGAPEDIMGAPQGHEWHCARPRRFCGHHTHTYGAAVTAARRPTRGACVPPTGSPYIRIERSPSAPPDTPAPTWSMTAAPRDCIYYRGCYKDNTNGWAMECWCGDTYGSQGPETCCECGSGADVGANHNCVYGKVITSPCAPGSPSSMPNAAPPTWPPTATPLRTAAADIECTGDYLRDEGDPPTVSVPLHVLAKVIKSGGGGTIP